MGGIVFDEMLSRQIVGLWNEGHSSGWIARELGMTRNTVMGLISRARNRGWSVSRKKSDQMSNIKSLRDGRPLTQTHRRIHPQRSPSPRVPHIIKRREIKPPRVEANEAIPENSSFHFSRKPEPSKSELRAMLAQALANTAALTISTD